MKKYSKLIVFIFVFFIFGLIVIKSGIIKNKKMKNISTEIKKVDPTKKNKKNNVISDIIESRNKKNNDEKIPNLNNVQIINDEVVNNNQNNNIYTNNNIINDESIIINQEKKPIQKENNSNIKNDESKENNETIIKEDNINTANKNFNNTLSNWFLNQLSIPNTTISKYFNNKAKDTTLDSTGLVTGIIVNNELISNSIVKDSDIFSWKIIKGNNIYYIYITNNDIKKFNDNDQLDAFEYNSLNNNCNNIKVQINTKEQDKNTNFKIMNKISEKIDTKIILNKINDLLNTQNSILYNYFKSYLELDSAGGNTGKNSLNIIKTDLSLDSNYKLSFKIIKQDDNSYNIYIINGIDIMNNKLNDVINDVYKINTKDLNNFNLVDVTISKNGMNNNIMIELEK